MNKKVVFLTVALVAAYNNYNLMPNFTNKQVLAEEQRIVSQSSLINEKIKKIDKKLAPEKKTEMLYNIFAVKKGGLKVDDSRNNQRPPRLTAETLQKGGDCSEFALVISEAIKQLDLDGGAYFLRMKNAPKDTKHIVVYVKIGNEKIVIDPQADSLNKILDGSEYEIIYDLSLNELQYIFYREEGDYYRKVGNVKKAINSYTRAIAYYEKDVYVLYNLANLYHKIDDLENANKYAEKVLQFDIEEEKRKSMFRIKVEYLVANGIKKCMDGKISDGVSLLKEAKRIGVDNNVVDLNDLKIINDNIVGCGKLK